MQPTASDLQFWAITRRLPVEPWIGGVSLRQRISSGAEGLDRVLRGGFPIGNLYLVQGKPGTGKTTIALQFLRAGAALGERCLYVSLSQTGEDLAEIAASHGWSLDGIDIVELQTQDESRQAGQSIFQTSDLRLDRTREQIEAAIEKYNPERLVYDSLLEVRLLTDDMARYQRELIGLRAFVGARGITTLLLDTDLTGDSTSDSQSRGIVHGIVSFDKTLPAFGRAKRRIEVSKMRGVALHDGWHDMDIRSGEGVVVFPRLSPEIEDEVALDESLIRSGRERLDAMFGGGMEAGTTTMVVGQAGTGKSTMASLYATAALERGEEVVLFLFEERVETFFRRSEGLGMDLRGYHAEGKLRLFDFNPEEITAGEFGQIVQGEAESDKLRVVVIDSFTGYMNALAHADQALFDIQSMLKHLAHRNVLTILIVAQHGLLGHNIDMQLDLSFLGDTVLFLRMREEDRQVRRDIVAVKKRHGPHDMAIRELIIEPGRVDIAEIEDRA